MILRALSPLLLAVLLPLSATFAQQGTPLAAGVERQRAQQAVKLLENALGDCLKTKLSTLLAQAGVADPIGYEDATLGQALDKARQMIGSGKVRKHAFAGTELGQALTAPGTDADVILISDELIDSAAITGTAASEVALRTQSVFLIAETLLNEIVHVFQLAQGISNAAHCDAERDSDVLSKKFADRVQKALSSDVAACTPHTTVAAVGADPDAVKGLAPLLTGLGLTPANQAQQLADLLKLVKDEAKKFKDRIEKIFVPFLTTTWPYGNRGHEHRRAGKVPCPQPARAGADVEDGAGGVSNHALPPGESIVNAFAQDNGLDQLTLYMLSIDAAFQLRMRFWVDGDGDGLPEPAEAGPPLAFPAPLAGDPGLDGVGMHGLFPDLLHPLGQGDGFLIHDLLGGGFFAVALDVDGTPLDVKLLANDPALATAGGFVSFGEIRALGAGDLRFVFGTAGRLARGGGSPAFWIDLLGANPLTGGVPVPSGPGFTLAQALGNSNHVGIDRLDHNVPGAFRLAGIPGTAVNLSTWNGFGVANVAGGVVQNDGFTALLASNPPIASNRVYVVSDGSDVHAELEPALGTPTDTLRVDVDGDGTPDRLDLTRAPARLHVSGGIPFLGPNDPHVQHVYEMVLEDQRPSFFAPGWGAPDRTVVTQEDVGLDLTPLAGSAPPLFVQSIVDLDGDAGADESVIIRRQGGNPDFFFEVIDGIPAAPGPVQAIVLPQGFEPGHMTVIDVDADGDLDVCVTNAFEGLPGASLLNDGAGQFVLALDPRFPGTQEDFGLQILLDGLVPPLQDLVPITGNQVFSFVADSPNGTFDFDPLVAFGQAFTTGSPPFGIPTFDIWIDLGGTPAPFLLFDGSVPGPLGASELLLPGGNLHSFLVPPGLGGQSLMLQALTLSPTAQNGFFPTSNAVELRFE